MLLVIFGASGDLAKRKLYPALRNISQTENFPDKVVGISRKTWDNPAYRRLVDESSGGDFGDSFLEKFEFMTADFSDMTTLTNLKLLCENRLKEDEEIFFYYAIEPDKFATLTNSLAQVGILTHQKSKNLIRLIIEKPFGTDYESAERLFALLQKFLPSQNIFLTDHVLNQEGLLDLIELKTHNPILKSWLTSKFVTQIQVTYSEKIGIEARGSFYEKTGAIKDMFQSHLCELVSMILTEGGAGIDGSNRAGVLSSLEVIQAVVGQYQGYRQEENVGAYSNVETFLAGELRSSLNDWQGVPILIRSGKKMLEKFIDVHFIADKNVLTIRLVPNSGINLRLWKGDGDDLDNLPDPVDLSYCYRPGQIPDPYTQVLNNAFTGQAELFVTMDEVLQSWKLAESFGQIAQANIKSGSGQPELYQPGSTGPAQAAEIPQKYGTNWIEEDYFKFCRM